MTFRRRPKDPSNRQRPPGQARRSTSAAASSKECKLHSTRALITRLADIDDALGRIDNGTYGQCEQCGWAIPIARLEAIPHARLCVACQQDQEVDLRGRQHR